MTLSGRTRNGGRMAAEDFVSYAHKLADAARRETLDRVGSPAAEDKSDGGDFDPVTEADRAAERVMRSLIERDFPDHSISGEEYGDKAGSAPFGWSLDPIDGTRSFTCGLPTWTTLIALLEQGEPVLGIIDAPVLDERYAGFGDQAWLSKGGMRQALRASGCTVLADARLSTTDPYLFDERGRECFERLRKAVRTTRFGHDAFGYARLAAGSLDLVVECGLKAHDYQALVPVVRGAGGVFGDWDGGSEFNAGEVIAAATPELYRAAVAIMRPARSNGDAP